MSQVSTLKAIDSASVKRNNPNIQQKISVLCGGKLTPNAKIFTVATFQNLNKHMKRFEVANESLFQNF